MRTLGERGLGGVVRGEHERACASPRLQSHGQRAAHRPQFARKGKFTRELVPC